MLVTVSYDHCYVCFGLRFLALFLRTHAELSVRWNITSSNTTLLYISHYYVAHSVPEMCVSKTLLTLSYFLGVSRMMKTPKMWFSNRSNANTSTEDGRRLEILDLESRGIVLSM